MENMLEKIKKVAAKVFECEVNDGTSQVNCESWDSLHHLNFVVELEITFDIYFEPEEIAEMKSIKEVEKALKLKMT